MFEDYMWLSGRVHYLFCVPWVVSTVEMNTCDWEVGWVTDRGESVDGSVHVARWGNECTSPASYMKAIFIKHIKAKV